MSTARETSDQPAPALDRVRLLCLRSVMADYGPWYLLRMPSGLWSIAWVHTLQSRERLEWHFLQSESVDGEYTFDTRADAMREIINSFDKEVHANPAGNTAYRSAAVQALGRLLSGAMEETQNDFAGTPAESRLLRSWLEDDEYQANLKKAAIALLAARQAAAAEQDRRERVFDQIVRVFGAKAVEEINHAIGQVWQEMAPTIKRAARGISAGSPLPMPQLMIINGRPAFDCGRAKPLPIRTPLSKPDALDVFRSHWKNPAWQRAEGLIGAIIDRLEVEAKTLPSSG